MYSRRFSDRVLVFSAVVSPVGCGDEETADALNEDSDDEDEDDDDAVLVRYSSFSACS